MLPKLPPAYHLVAVDREADAFARALRAAPRGAEDGTLYWTDREDRLRLAIVVEPEMPVQQALEAHYVLAVATCDALSILLPPHLPLAFAWPADLLLDGARLGRFRLALAPMVGATPPWMVLGLEVPIAALPGEPGQRPDRTTLHDSGAVAIDATGLAEAVARHFLAWSYRWQEEGFAPVRAAWNARCYKEGEHGHLALAGWQFTGAVHGLDEAGRFVVGGRALELEPVLGELALL